MLLVGTKLDLRNDVNTIAKLREKNQSPISFEEGVELVRLSCTNSREFALFYVRGALIGTPQGIGCTAILQGFFMAHAYFDLEMKFIYHSVVTFGRWYPPTHGDK